MSVQVKTIIHKKEGKTVNVYPRFITLMSRMFSEVKVILVTFDKEEEGREIAKIQNIPKSEEGFKKYCYDVHMTRDGQALYYMFRILSPSLRAWA